MNLILARLSNIVFLRSYSQLVWMQRGWLHRKNTFHPNFPNLHKNEIFWAIFKLNMKKYQKRQKLKKNLKKIEYCIKYDQRQSCANIETRIQIQYSITSTPKRKLIIFKFFSCKKINNKKINFRKKTNSYFLRVRNIGDSFIAPMFYWINILMSTSLALSRTLSLKIYLP